MDNIWLFMSTHRLLHKNLHSGACQNITNLREKHTLSRYNTGFNSLLANNVLKDDARIFTFILAQDIKISLEFGLEFFHNNRS